MGALVGSLRGGSVVDPKHQTGRQEVQRCQNREHGGEGEHRSDSLGEEAAHEPAYRAAGGDVAYGAAGSARVEPLVDDGPEARDQQRPAPPQRPFPGGGIMRAFLLLGWLMPIVVSASIWKWLLDGDYGVINSPVTIHAGSVIGEDGLGYAPVGDVILQDTETGVTREFTRLIPSANPTSSEAAFSYPLFAILSA